MCIKSVAKFLVFLYLINVNSAQDSDNSNDISKSISLADSLSWSCANNFNCIANAANKVVTRVMHKKQVDFGVFSLDPVKNEIDRYDGRTKSSFMEQINSYSLNVPIGPMVFSLGRSVEHPNYLEVALSKRSIDGKTLIQSSGLNGLITCEIFQDVQIDDTSDSSFQRSSSLASLAGILWLSLG